MQIPSLPLIPLPVGVAGEKRVRHADFNPAEDVEAALQQFGSVRDDLSPVERQSALALFTEFLSDIVAGKTAIFDIETTEYY